MTSWSAELLDHRTTVACFEVRRSLLCSHSLILQFQSLILLMLQLKYMIYFVGDYYCPNDEGWFDWADTKRRYQRSADIEGRE